MNRLLAPNEMEVSIFSELISTLIHDCINKLHLECADGIEESAKKLLLHAFSGADLQKKVQAVIVRRYAGAASNLVAKIQKLISHFFGVDAVDIPQPALPAELYDFQINTRLVKAYYHTERLADLTEKIIDQTMDMAFLSGLDSPFAKTLGDPLKPGGIVLGAAGLDIYSHMAANKKDISRRLNGISKNIGLRLESALRAHYSACIYAIADEQDEDTLQQAS